MATHSGTFTKRLERVLIAIAENSESSIDQVLDATRQLIGIKRVKAKRKPVSRSKQTGAPNKDMLGSK